MNYLYHNLLFGVRIIIECVMLKNRKGQLIFDYMTTDLIAESPAENKAADNLVGNSLNSRSNTKSGDILQIMMFFIGSEWIADISFVLDGLSLSSVLVFLFYETY